MDMAMRGAIRWMAARGIGNGKISAV